MKIWIDLINASHVLFFYSLLKDINQKNITFTVRDRAETVNLAKSFGLNATIVGKYRMNNIKKSLDMILRTIQLNFIKIDHDISLSFENGMNVAVSKFQGKQSILFCDNDLKLIQQNSLIQNLETKIKSMSNHILIPKACEKNFKKVMKHSNIITYDGYKEDIYLADFRPDPTFLKKLPFDNYVVIRPEDSNSFYVNEKTSLVPELIKKFQKENINVVYLPREEEDKRYVQKHNDAFIPQQTFNGLDLAYHADAILTGSGTMAREAACMNKPAISFFPSKKLLSVDEKLKNEEKIFHSRNPDHIVQYVKEKTKTKNTINLNRSKNVKQEIINIIQPILTP